MSISPAPIVPDVVSQHLEEASFLWLLRSAAVSWPNFSLADLSKLDRRVAAHLDGLHIAGEFAWTLCLDELKWKDAGELFAAGMVALTPHDPVKFEKVLAAAIAAPQAAGGIVSALGWLPLDQANRLIQPLLHGDHPVKRLIGIAASAVHRHNAGPALAAAASDANVLLRARALKAAGELGRVDLLPALRANLSSDDPACRYWAAWSFALRGTDPAMGIAALRAIAESSSPFAARAAAMAVRRMDIPAAHAWYRKLPAALPHLRSAIVAAGALGDPQAVPWLIDLMKQLPLARVAGEAFTTITGADLAYLDLDTKPPKDFDAGPTDDPDDENVELDPDGNLPWPNVKAITEWWAGNGAQFPAGVRHLAGKPMTPDGLQHVLRAGRQRQRTAAALELAIRQPGTPLFETRMPGFRQKQIL